MNRQDLVNRVQDIFRDIFNIPGLDIYDGMTAYDLSAWDSLNHINLLVAIQQEFTIKFSLEELQHLNNVGEIIELILKKTRNCPLTSS